MNIFAGSGISGGKDGPKDDAEFIHPSGLTISPDGTYMLVCDAVGHCIRSIDLKSGQVTTLVGHNHDAKIIDGPLSEASLKRPIKCVFSMDGKYIFVACKYCIRLICMETRELTTLIGDNNRFKMDATCKIDLGRTTNCTLSPDGKNLYICDVFNHCIYDYCIETQKCIVFAGVKWKKGLLNSYKTCSLFEFPFSCEFTRDGKDLIVCDGGNKCIRSINMKSQKVSFVRACFKNPKHCVLDPSRNSMLICNGRANSFSKICLDTYIISVVHALQVNVSSVNDLPYSVIFSPCGKFIFYSDTRQHCICCVKIY